MKVATGVGSGHFVRGEVYRGAMGVAGEIGHLTIDSHGRPCVCGLRGCLTTFVGAPALVERARELRGEHPESTLAEGEITIEDIEGAALGDLKRDDRIDRRARTLLVDHRRVAVAARGAQRGPIEHHRRAAPRAVADEAGELRVRHVRESTPRAVRIAQRLLRDRLQVGDHVDRN